MQLGGVDYLAVFGVTLALTVGLTPLLLKLALRRQILDHPGEIKAQESPVPYLGGLAIVGSFAVVVLVAALIKPPASGLGELALILGLGVLLAVVGLVDDLKGLSPWLRLAVEVGAGVAVWATATGAEIFGNDVLNLVVTVAWVVGVTNAFNLLDNMDGLSAGVAAIAALFVFVLAADGGQFLVATLAIALAGCAAGFLRSNFHPARIYMGDAGALFIGFLLAVLCMKLRFPAAPRVIGLFVPLLVLGIALFDTTLVTVNRLLHHKNPLAGGRDHASHRLVFVGIAVPAAVALIYVAAASLGCLAFVLSRADRTTGLVLIAWVLAVAATFGVLLSLVPVYATSTRRHLMLKEVVRHEPEPPASIGHDEAESA
ncbi:MAG TPA: MraY family glycosyltransferase [Acidimicrobiia bacterium]|nr:MraY family glycosyltransferase [Acidimicrobiia bacterium]